MTPDASAYDHALARAMEFSDAGDVPRAIEYFLEASQAQPSAGLPQFLLGAEYAAAGDMANAEAAFANAARLAPDFPMARYQLGLVQFTAGRAAIALLTWQPLLDLPESDPLPHFVQGFDALARDAFDTALHHYRQGLVRNTSNAPLSRDIEKMIAAVEALQQRAVPDDTAESQAPRVDTHVLLANYQQQGRSH